MARRPTKIDVQGALKGLRINEGITSAMLPTVTFSPTLGITARRVDKLGIDIRSFHEPLKRSVQQVIAPSIKKNFDVGGRPEWEGFSEETPTIQDRIYHVSEHPLLVKSGLMRRTMGQLNIWSIGRETAILRDVPDKIWYARIHQAGYEGRGGGKKVGRRTLESIVRSALKGQNTGTHPVSPIPARPFVMLQEQDAGDIVRVFEKWLGERIDRTWPRRG